MRPQPYLFFYCDPLKEKGEEADIKKKPKKQKNNQNPPKQKRPKAG